MRSAFELLKLSWTLYRDQARLFIGYASWLLLSYAAIILVQFIPVGPIQIGVAIVVQLLDLILWFWVSIVTTKLTVGLVSGSHFDPDTLSRNAWLLLSPFAVVSLLQGLVTVGGFLLLVVPGFLFLVWYAYAQEAVIIDNKRGIEALNVSRELSRGRFFLVVKYLFTGPFIVLLCSGATALLLITAIFALTGIGTDAIFSEQPPLWADAIPTVISIFVMPLLYAYGTLSYLELKK